MNIKKLESLEQFEKLEKGETILVIWSDFFVRHTEGASKIMVYNIEKLQKYNDEIICKIKGNHFFNYKMHLGLDTPGINTSQALEVYKLEVKHEQTHMQG